MTLRRSGARLAVLLITIGLGGFGGLLGVVIASADDGCVLTPTGIECSYHGTTTSTSVVSRPPFRYLGVTTHPAVGTCWYWSRYPPGYDSWDSANDQWIILSRHWYPECPSAGGSTVVNVTSRAWEVFRSFPLVAPDPGIRPTIGITNLASLMTVRRASPLDHTETLPDGRVLEVRATVRAIRVDWGDGYPAIAHPAIQGINRLDHVFALKTCPPSYRVGHPLGGNCHPSLAAYPIDVTFVWEGRYRTGGSWIRLGDLDRTTRRLYDVDEVVGIPVR